jgi:iron(III) transport system permease protein
VIPVRGCGVGVVGSCRTGLSRGSYGIATAFSAILTVLTAVILLVYLKFTQEDNIKL